MHVAAFKMEYDKDVYTDLPRTLACTHKELTRFPFKNCEISYDQILPQTWDERDDDNNSYCSANSCVEPATTSPNPANEGAGGHLDTGEDRFILVYKNVNIKQFSDVREQQRKCMKNVIEKAKEQHREILECLKRNVQKIRDVKRTLPDTDTMYKAAVAEAKKSLRLFKDPYEENIEGPMQRNVASRLKIKRDFPIPITTAQ